MAGSEPDQPPDPYSPSFDPESLPDEALAAYRQHRYRATFSVVLTILIHLAGLGMLTPMAVARLCAFLPVVRADDFSARKAYGRLLIPFYNLYWTFVLFRRIVDRLTFQARLWRIRRAPSKGVATTAAWLLCLSTIPYLGLVFWTASYVTVLPIYLMQLQGTCNRLALEAAPPHTRPSMRQLERATLLRWLGWIVLTPSVALLVASVAAALFVPTAPPLSISTLVGMLAFAIAGVALWCIGRLHTGYGQATLAGTAPEIAAAYLRIDKNAAWMVAAVAIPVGLILLAVGGVILFDPTAPAGEAVPVLLFGGLPLLASTYAVARALQLSRQIDRLERLHVVVRQPEPFYA